MLQRKRPREELLEQLDKPFSDIYLVYLDYYVTEHINPFAIRIWDPNHQILYAYVYGTRQDVLNKVLEHYKGKSRRPYWVDFIKETNEQFQHAFEEHFERAEVVWLASSYEVAELLENRAVEFYSTANHEQQIMKLLGCRMLKYHYIRSEDAYKVDFLREAANFTIKFDTVTLNNMTQAISSVRTKIIKMLDMYPYIYQLIEWRMLKHLFDTGLA